MDREFVTTTQAAKFCNVTRFTIRNWVNSGKLKSSLTAGGHRRIAKEDLIKFINKNKLAKISKADAELLTPRCWDFRNFIDSELHNCDECLVYKEKAPKCFLMVKAFGSKKVQCRHDCLSCDYILEYYPKEKAILEKLHTKDNSLKGLKNAAEEGKPSCWDFQQLMSSTHHNCSKCLVFKEKVNKCFLLVKQFGDEKIQCRHDCAACEYIKAYFPRQHKTLEKLSRLQLKHSVDELEDHLEEHLNQEEIAESRGILHKSLFSSGKYLGSFKKIIDKTKHLKPKKNKQP